jgi:anti-sigma factor RsiW
MKPEEAARLLHAYVDRELDAAKSLELEAQLAADPALRERFERLRDLSAGIREKADYHAAPSSLVARLSAVLPGAAPTGAAPRRATRWIMPVAVAALVAALALGIALVRPGDEEALAREMVASHVRSTLGNRLIDVASSDQHMVKPWLSARLPFSPPVADFAQEGFELAGARLDYVGGHPVAVLVYKRRQHLIDVFVWPGSGPRDGAYSRDGFNVERFSAEGMRICLVSDLNRNELSDLARLLIARR